MSGLPHFLDNRLTDGGEVVSKGKLEIKDVGFEFLTAVSMKSNIF
jgi:hypothetical protein